MNKEELDELYHNLRELCVTEDLFQKEAVAGIVSHLTQPQGDYTGLLRFLSYYGDSYILPNVLGLLHSSKHLFKFSRVVELGAGFGWLGRGISNAFGPMPALYVDKRQWPLIDIVADIETKNGVERVLGGLEDGDLIVASELLHCLGNPEKTLRPFTKWPILAVEYHPVRSDYFWSYITQIRKFNCRPTGDITAVFPEAKILNGSTDTHGIWLMLPLEKEIQLQHGERP